MLSRWRKTSFLGKSAGALTFFSRVFVQGKFLGSLFGSKRWVGCVWAEGVGGVVDGAAADPVKERDHRQAGVGKTGFGGGGS